MPQSTGEAGTLICPARIWGDAPTCDVTETRGKDRFFLACCYCCLLCTLTPGVKNSAALLATSCALILYIDDCVTELRSGTPLRSVACCYGPGCMEVSDRLIYRPADIIGRYLCVLCVDNCSTVQLMLNRVLSHLLSSLCHFYDVT